MLADCSAVTFCDSCYRITVCIVSKCRNFVVFWPCVKHWHSHSIVVRNNYVNRISKRRWPCSNSITCCCCIPCSSGRVLHFLRSKFSYNIFLSIYFKFCILNLCSFSVCVSSCRSTVDFSIFLNACSKSFTNTSCTSDGIVMSDITDC